ncbi:MAG: PspC domain-containing protein [Flavobacteriales bacterium]|nr:PspC domain-containing protein [Flavobacteriales bacterium]
MKKTLTANISGTVFHIEEDAYELLNRYLANIRGKFSGGAGATEIMGDIEARIAELFSERLVGRQVVTIADVEHVIGVMGQPEDYVGDEAGQEAGAGAGAGAGTTAGTGGPRTRRLYRHPEDQWVGGVFGGIAAYFNTDPLWFRIAFILFVIFGVGSPILIYLILWMLVPVAETPAERLMMEGEPVTVDNLKRAFEEGADKFKQGAERVAKEADELGRRWGASAPRAGQRAAAGVEYAARRGATAFAKLVGVFLLILGTALSLALVVAIVTGGTVTLDAFGDSTDVHAFAAAIFETPQQGFWAVTSAALLLLIPSIGIFLGGLRLTADVRTPKWLGWTLSAAWFAALVAVLMIVPRLVNDFRRTRTLTDEITLQQPAGQTLTLDLLGSLDEEDHKRWRVGYEHGHMDLDMDGFVVGDSLSLESVGVDVEPSPDSLFHLISERSAQGRGTKPALIRAEHITHRVVQQGDSLLIAPLLHAPLTDKFRAQRLRLVLQVPTGRAVHFGNNMGFLLDDVDNTTNTLDDDMVGRTWTMTSGGLSGTVTPEQVPDDLPAPPTPAKPVEPQAPEEDEAVPQDNRPRAQLPNLFNGLSRLVRS